jgi:type I restriction enzyme S subunit
MSNSRAVTKLEDVAEFIRGITFKPDDVVPPDTAGSVPCMRTKNVQSEIDLSDVWHVDSRLVKRSNQYLKIGDILVSSANSWNLVGKCCWVPKEASESTFGGFISVLRPNREKIDPRFLYHWFSSNRTQTVVRSFGRQTTNISNLDFARCLALSIPLPPLEEQRRVAQLLDNAYTLRVKRQKAITLLDNLAQAIFIDMFGCDEDADSLLGDHLSFVTSGGRGWAKYYSPSGARFIRSLDVRMNEIENRDAVYVTAPNNAEARRTRIEEGDVLLTITGSLIGRVAPVKEDLKGSFISQHVAILRPSNKSLRPEYLSFYLSLPSGGQRQIKKMQYGQTKPGLNFDQIRAFNVPVPTLSAQDAFLRRLAVIGRLRTAHNLHLAELDALFASLQQRAFRGERQDVRAV